MEASIIFSDDFFGREADSFLMRLQRVPSNCEVCEIAEMQGMRIDLRDGNTLSGVADLKSALSGGAFGFRFR